MRYNTADENGLAWFAATPTNPPFASFAKGAGRRTGILPLVEFSMSVQEKLGLPETIFIGDAKAQRKAKMIIRNAWRLGESTSESKIFQVSRNLRRRTKA
jgi:hypothetical protein